MTIIDILNILQRVMITGATSGIGQALADELALLAGPLTIAEIPCVAVTTMGGLLQFLVPY